MPKLEIIIDASVIVKAYRQGLEDAFLILKEEYPELDEQLNINKIDGEKTGD